MNATEWFVDFAQIEKRNFKETHRYGMIFIIGILFPASVITTHYGTCFTRMFRKIWHSSLQISGILSMYFFSIPMMQFPDDGTLIRKTHMILGYTILFGIIPLILITRFTQFKKYHIIFGKIALIIFAIECILGAIKYNDMVWIVITVFICFMYTIYAISSSLRGHPDVHDFIIRDSTGHYALVNTCEKTNILPVGSGWSSYLSKKIWTKKQYALTSMKGKYSNGFWGAGTTIAEMQNSLQKEGKSVISHPSILGATLGSWVFTNSHGNGGELWNEPFGDIVVFNTQTCSVEKIKNRHILFNDHKSIEEQRKYIILEVQVKSQKNELCYQQVEHVTKEKDLKSFFSKDTFLRAIFINSHDISNITWTKNNTKYKPSFIGSLFPIGIFGTKILPHFFTRCIPSRIWNQTVTLSEANRFVGTDPPYWTGFFAYFYTNVEIFIKKTVSTVEMFNLCKLLKSFFKTHCYGRCELRYEGGKLCMDFVLMTNNYDDVFELLYAHFGKDTKFSIHKGKYQVVMTGPSILKP